MIRLSNFFAVVSIAMTILIGSTAHAASNWESYSVKVASDKADVVVAAIDKFMATEAGKTMPGAYSFMASVMDGGDPATNSFIWSVESMAAREKWTQSMQGNADWSEFLDDLTEATELVGTSRMIFEKSWGESGDTDTVWFIHALDIPDGGAYQAALNGLMTSAIGKKFPGSMHLSSVAAAGIAPATHVISVGFQSEAEAEAWNEMLYASPEYAAFQKSTADAYEFHGTFVLHTVKSWGEMEMP